MIIQNLSYVIYTSLPLFARFYLIQQPPVNHCMNQCLHLGHGLWSQMDGRTTLVVKLVLQLKIKSEIQLCLFVQIA